MADEPVRPADVLAPFVRPYYREPLVVARAKGTRVWGTDGREYLDAYAGVATVALGHCADAVDEAAFAQARRHGHVSANYVAEVVPAYAAELLRALGPGLDRVFLVNSGSEAVDLCLCLARVTAGAETVVALREGYHGGSYLSKSATGLPTWHFAAADAPGLVHVPGPSCWGCPHRPACRPPEAPCLGPLDDALGAASRAGRRPILLLEPIPGVGGIVVPPEGWFLGVRALVAAHRALLVVDEVQTGFGRCGDRLFGFQRFGLAPDLVAMGKGIANGWPLGAVAMSAEVAAANRDLLHFNTFGGHPVSVAAARVTLGLLSDPGLLAGVTRRGEEMKKEIKRGLAWLAPDVRGVGFMVGVELAVPELAPACVEECRARGVLVGLGGLRRSVVRLQPPLVFSDEEAGAAARAVVASLLSLDARRA